MKKIQSRDPIDLQMGFQWWNLGSSLGLHSLTIYYIVNLSVNFLFRKISEKNSTCSECLPNFCQWKRFFTHFYKGGWCSENLRNIEKHNANRARKLCSQYEKCVSTTNIKLSISSFQFVY